MRLSLIAAAPDGDDGQAFFESLRTNGLPAGGEVEVLVVQSSARPLAAAPDGVQVLTAAGPCSIFELWGIGVRRAAGAYVAVLDVRCPLAPGWLASLLAALESGAPAYFGPVRCAWPPSHPQALGYVVEYVQFAPPVSETVGETPGVNAVIARNIAQHPSVLGSDGFVKTRVLLLLAAAGQPPPQLVPGAQVVYRKTFAPADYLRHRYGHGRCYAAGRAFAGPFGRLRGVLASPLLPLLRTLRIWRHVRRTPYRQTFWRFAPSILLAESAWSLGELSGYVAGAGRWWSRLR